MIVEPGRQAEHGCVQVYLMVLMSAETWVALVDYWSKEVKSLSVWGVTRARRRVKEVTEPTNKVGQVT